MSAAWPPAFHAMSAAQLRAGLQRGEWSCVEQTRALLVHARVEDARLNATTGLDEDWILAQARAADVRLQAGERAAWLGLPVTAKDNLWIAGRRVSNGSRLFRDFVAPADAVAVARLRRAGAVFLGSTVCSEFACKGIGVNPLHGQVRNPWDPARTTGGSSAGAAAATAAGIGCLALATDAGGSTRRPAAHSGVVGMKPSAGWVPHPTGFAEPVYGNSVVGLMARSVADAASALAAIAGPDAADPQSACLPPLALEDARCEALPRARIAFSPRFGLGCAVDADVEAALEATADALAAAGHEVLRLDPVWPDGASEESLMPLQHAGLAAIYGPAWRARAWEADPDIAAQIESGLALDGASVARALELRKGLYASFHALFAQCDLLLAPTTPCTAWPLGAAGPATIGGRPASPRAHAAFTPFVNHAFVPACSVPCGLDRAGLPIGAQVVGPLFSDLRVLALAAWIERLRQDAIAPLQLLSTP